MATVASRAISARESVDKPSRESSSKLHVPRARNAPGPKIYGHRMHSISSSAPSALTASKLEKKSMLTALKPFSHLGTKC